MWDKIAFEQMGSVLHTDKLMKANVKYASTYVFPAGVVLTIPEVEDLSFRQAYAILRARGFEKIEIEYVPGDFKDLALGVELHGRVLQKGEHVPLTAPLVLKVSSGDAEMPVDSLGLPDDSVPVESLDSEEENWF